MQKGLTSLKCAKGRNTFAVCTIDAASRISHSVTRTSETEVLLRHRLIAVTWAHLTLLVVCVVKVAGMAMSCNEINVLFQ